MPVLEQMGPDALRHTLVTYRNTMKRHQAADDFRKALRDSEVENIEVFNDMVER